MSRNRGTAMNRTRRYWLNSNGQARAGIAPAELGVRRRAHDCARAIAYSNDMSCGRRIAMDATRRIAGSYRPGSRQQDVVVKNLLLSSVKPLWLRQMHAKNALGGGGPT